MLRRTPLARVGRAAKRDEARREEVRDIVRRRDGNRCRGFDLVPEVRCSGPLDVDEIVLRSGYPGGHLDPTNCQLLCRYGHHRWKHDNPDAAVERGLRKYSWECGG